MQPAHPERIGTGSVGRKIPSPRVMPADDTLPSPSFPVSHSAPSNTHPRHPSQSRSPPAGTPTEIQPHRGARPGSREMALDVMG